MARIYGEIASSALMTFDKSFSRSNGQPLDSTEVYYSLAAAQAYAQTDVAYVGQKLVVIETVDEVTTVAHYGIEADGSLKELGAIPVGDGMTVEVVNGKIQLAALEGHNEGTYQPFLVDGKIEWREPSATTVEGLDGRLTTAEGDIEALEAAVGNVYTKEEADAKYAPVGDYATKEEAQGYANAKDEAIAAAKKAGDDAQDAVDALVEKIGTVEENKTVVQMIADAKEAATYDDTDLAGRVSAIEGDYLKAEHKTALEKAISDGDAKALEDAQAYADGLNSAMDARVTAIANDYLKAQDKTDLSDAIAAAEESAVDRVLGYLAEEQVNTSYDTLKEIAAWIESDTTASAEFVTRVSNIEKDYLKGADKTALQGEIDALETLVGSLPEGAVSTTVVAYIQEVVDGLKIGDYAKASDLTALAEKVSALEDKIGVAEEHIGEINSVLESKVDVAEGYRLMSDVEGSKLAGVEDGAQVNKVETVGAEFNLTDRHLTIAAIEQSKVTGLIAALEGKVDKAAGARLLTEDEATKLEKLVLGDNGEVSVSGKVAAGNVEGLDTWITARAGTLEGLSENNLTDALLTKLEGVAAGAQVNVIDGVSDEFTIAADGKILNVKTIAQEKVVGLIDALAGKVDTVAGKGLSSNDLTDELLDKLNASQANVLESVSVAGTLLEIVDKQVNIPVATADAHGVVKSAAGENKVAVAADGTMEVNSLNVNKLVQTDGEYVIMNGGSAAI